MALAVREDKFEITSNNVFYDFQVTLGPEDRWTVRKTYEDFEALHKTLCEMYTGEQDPPIPYLTGRCAPWNRLKQNTAERRLPKLHAFTSELIDACRTWRPHFVVQVAHPTNYGVKVEVNKFVFEFLEVADNYCPHPLPPSMPAAATAAADKASAAAGMSRRSSMVNGPGAAAAAAPPSGPRSEGASSTGGSPTQPASTTTPSSKMGRPRASFISSPAQANKGTIEEDGFVLCDAPVVSKEQLLRESNNITAQTQAAVTKFIIIQSSHIEFQISIMLCGRRWEVRQRYSAFERLHKELGEVYGADVLPDISPAKVAVWKKLDEATGVLRQEELTKYLQLVIKHIDQWEPIGAVVAFELGITDASAALTTAASNGATSLTVFYNKFLFDFLDLSSHVFEFTAGGAVKEMKKKEASLSRGVRDMLEDRRLKQKKLMLAKTMARRGSMLTPLEDNEVKDFCELLSSVDDDQDALNVVLHFCETGVVRHDVAELEQERLAADAQQKAQQNALMRSNTVGGFGAVKGRKGQSAAGDFAATQNDAASDDGNGFDSPAGGTGLRRATSGRSQRDQRQLKTAVGVSSEHCVKIAEAIYFNDTRATVILHLAATVMMDDRCLEEIVGTLIYDWETVLANMEETIRVDDGLVHSAQVIAE